MLMILDAFQKLQLLIPQILIKTLLKINHASSHNNDRAPLLPSLNNARALFNFLTTTIALFTKTELLNSDRALNFFLSFLNLIPLPITSINRVGIARRQALRPEFSYA
jgi:hypothetical protein